MRSLENYIYNIKEINNVANRIMDKILHKNIVFKGEMGAGKTTLIKSLCKSFGVHDQITSPTFSLINEYSSKDKSIYHMDLFRIKSIEEASNFGIEEYIYSNSFCFIEWGEIIFNIIPKEHHEINIYKIDELTRKISFK